MSQNEVIYDFKNGDKHTYHVLSASDISNDQLVADSAGLYAWYLRLDKSVRTVPALASYSQVFASKQLEVDLTANLGERYTGNAKRVPPFTDNPPTFAQATLAASTVFAPPIYIGIASSIRTRLRQHSRHLTDALSKPLPSDLVDEGDIDNDTDQESQYFGERIANLLRSQNIRYINGLFVKVIYQPSQTRSELLSAEYFVNRTFVPICGRR